MNIFERIQHDTGLENYCTDILVGILSKNQLLLRQFCVDVLKIPEDKLQNNTSLKIRPQAYYKGIDSDSKKSLVDIEISGTDFLCFLEMKVESTQNDGQLKKYNEVLKKQKETTETTKYLRFCTKYNEEITKENREDFEKTTNPIKYFHQFRWYDIHDFLSNYRQDNTLTNEFLEFLTLNFMDNKMLLYNSESAFSSFNNLEIFKNILENLKKEVRDTSEKKQFITVIRTCLGSKITPDLHFKNKRFGLTYFPYKDEKIDKNFWTSIFIGFEFKEDGIYNKVDFWSKSNETKLNVHFFKDNSIDAEYIEHGKEFGFVIYQKLQTSGIKMIDIINWFIKILENIKDNQNPTSK